MIFDPKKDGFSDLDCNCPYGAYCKHSVALGLEFISRYSEFLKTHSNYSEEELVDYLNGKEKPKSVIKKNVNDKYASGCDYDIKDDYDKKNDSEEDEEWGGEWETEWGEEYYDNYQSSKKKPPKGAFGNYRVILSENYGHLSLNIKGGQDHDLSAKDIVEFDKNLTGAEKKLFRFIQGLNSYYDTGHHWLLFELFKEAGTPVYWEKEQKKNQFYFSEDGQKLKVAIVKQKNRYNQEDEVCFRLNGEYFKKRVFKLLSAEKGFVTLADNQISFINLHPILISIIEKASKNNYSFYNENLYEAILSDEEVIKINDILGASLKYLDLSTNLEKIYNVQEFKDAVPCVAIDYDSKKGALEAKVMIDYGFKKIDVAKSVSRSSYKGNDTFNRWGSNYIIAIEHDNIFYARVLENLEISVYKTIYSNWQDYGFKRNITCKLESEKEIYKFIDKNLPNLKRLNYKIEFVRDKFDLVEHKFKADFDIDLNAENDWLSFDVACYCGEDKISLEVLRNYVKGKVKNGYINLGGGRLWKISNGQELERFILMLEMFYENENNKFEGRIYHAPELEALFENSKYYKGKLSESFKEFMNEAKKGKSVRKIKLPSEFDNILRDYQKEGINWFYFLRKYRFGGILADDMGTGKTLQTLTLLNMNRNKGRSSIVICPKSLLYNWIAEVEKFTPRFRAIVLDGTPAERMEKIKESSRCDLIITSYATMQRDFEYYEKNKIKFNYCVLDEAQFIKNHNTKNARTVKKIDADYRLVLTGTPLENSVSEIWSIFDFLMPGFLGHNAHFNERFQNPIMKRNCGETLNNLRKKIECFMLRRTKEEVLKELPPKIEQYNYCYLEPSQNILYQEILANVRSEIFKTVDERGFAKSQIHILAGLTKLRQVCNHPNLLLGKKDYARYESAKLNMFNELIGEIISSGRKVLVFSQFTTMLDILSRELRDTPHNYLSGQTRNRQELVDDFNNNAEKKVFLISLKAGGTGLNLTSADNVIIFDPWWNPSVERQAIDRTHRIGQTKSVNVYRLITKGTIEEKIIKLQERKKFLFDNLVSESHDLFKKLTWDDVKELFK
ncbi:hypothetical protein A2Y83_01200 [Candidatus Falkowbacteria bacterium RBG_13_39_14]|uniref:Helicase SNF2 n=1 Tax=Candidatus Falkowbacteria bacterium RBG_13_39_14 TaxID=1797985 RepID=A0A1F5S5M9_9BACT|nr:MAG: hypothetical protein A2Y83_01200 [Candidatus Falkowbacteria bacterium RBG_13_39_14]